MTRFIRDFRIIPVVLVAIAALFVLKSFGLIFEGGYIFAGGSRPAEDGDITGTVTGRPGEGPPVEAAAPAPPPAAPKSWAQQMFGYPDITGSLPDPKSKQEAKEQPKGAQGKEPQGKESKGKEPEAKGKPAEPVPNVAGKKVPIPIEGGRVQSPAERALLERLAERRQELEARAKELEMRESLVLAAEKRLEGRVSQLKKLEAQINEAVRAKDEGEVSRLRNVITMYENMKAKDAARVFDRLDMRILVEVAAAINPRRMSDIMAQMSPDSAERLTVELARRGKERPPAELPKIEGRPTGK